MTSRVSSKNKEKKAKRENSAKKRDTKQEKKNGTKKQKTASPGVELKQIIATPKITNIRSNKRYIAIFAGFFAFPRPR